MTGHLTGPAGEDPLPAGAVPGAWGEPAAAAPEPAAVPGARGEPAAAAPEPGDRGPAGEPAAPGPAGHPAVDAALAAVAHAAGAAPADQLPAYQAAHRTLRETLAGIDDG